MAAGWNPDPSGRYALRYFDGQRWTDDVSDGTGSMLKDPEPVATAVVVPPPPSQPPAPPSFAPQRPASGSVAPWNGLAIAGFVLSMLWIYGIGSILAIIFGHVARSQIKRDGTQGSGLALAGLIIGYIGLAGMVLFVIIIALAVDGPGYSTYV